MLWDRLLSRLRGNPIALATILVAALTAVAAFLIPGKNDLLSGALLGASVSAIVGLLNSFLAEPDLRDVPNAFKEASKDELLRPGYYRHNHRLSVEIETKSNPNVIEKVVITSSAKVIATRDNVQIRPVRVEAPKGYKINEYTYKINEHIIHKFKSTPANPSVTEFEVPYNVDMHLNDVKTEVLNIVYSALSGAISKVSDKHSWDSPVDGFILDANVNDDVSVYVRTTSGKVLDEERRFFRRYRSYSLARASFSHQGILWSVEI